MADYGPDLPSGSSDPYLPFFLSLDSNKEEIEFLSMIPVALIFLLVILNSY